MPRSNESVRLCDGAFRCDRSMARYRRCAPHDTASEASDLDVGPFDGSLDLATKLAKSDMVKECVVSQMFQYAMRREPTADNQCGLAALKQTFVTSQLSMKDLLVGITQSSAFFSRVEPKE